VLLVEQNAFAALKIADYACVLEVGAIVLQGTSSPTIACAAPTSAAEFAPVFAPGMPDCRGLRALYRKTNLS
jgi:hypothetical protein